MRQHFPTARCRGRECLAWGLLPDEGANAGQDVRGLLVAAPPSDEEECSMHVNLRGKHWAVVRDDGQVLANGFPTVAAAWRWIDRNAQ